jgi:hypothetical protein
VIVPTIELLRQWRVGLIEGGVRRTRLGGWRRRAPGQGSHGDDVRLGGDATAAPQRVRAADRGRGPPPGAHLSGHRREGGCPLAARAERDAAERSWTAPTTTWRR